MFVFSGLPLHALHGLHGANGRHEDNAHAATADQAGLDENVGRVVRTATSGRR